MIISGICIALLQFTGVSGKVYKGGDLHYIVEQSRQGGWIAEYNHPYERVVNLSSDELKDFGVVNCPKWLKKRKKVEVILPVVP